MSPEKPEQPDEPTTKRQPTDAGRHHSLLAGMLAGVRQVGRDVISVTLGRLVEDDSDKEETASQEAEADEPSSAEAAAKRVGALHAVTEHLRGAADRYVAAKLDEIEARVDQKLDGIEERVDRKIVELHEQLAEMRDRELRHRLRLLKITLVFTVLVAVLSLLYKWLEKIWQLG